MTMYEISKWNDDGIKPCDLVKMTEKTIVYSRIEYNGKRRESRSMDKSNFFPSWEEANAALIKRSEDRIESLRRQLEREKGICGNLRGRKNPEVINEKSIQAAF